MPDVAIGDVTANHFALQGPTLVREGADGSAGSFDGADSATVANDSEKAARLAKIFGSAFLRPVFEIIYSAKV